MHKPIFWCKFVRDSWCPHIKVFQHPISSYLQQFVLESVSTNHNRKFLAVEVQSSVQHEQRKQKQLIFNFKCLMQNNCRQSSVVFNVTHIRRSIFTRSSTGICHSTHSSFPVVLGSNGTSENRKIDMLVIMNDNRN